MNDSSQRSAASENASIQEEDYPSRQALLDKINQQRARIAKAINLIQSKSQIIEELENELSIVERRVTELECIIAGLKANEPVEGDTIGAVLSRVKVLDCIWVHVRTEMNGVKWYRESSLRFPGRLPEVLDDSCRASVVEATLKQVTTQYEERLQRLQRGNEAIEEQFHYLQIAYKELQTGYGELMREQADKPLEDLSALITRSLRLEFFVKAVQNGEMIDLQKVQQLLVEFSGGPVHPALQSIQDRITSLHSSIFDLAKRLLHSRNELDNQEAAWKVSFGALVREKEDLKMTLSRVRLEINYRTEEATQKYDKSKEDYSRILETRDSEISRLRSDLDKQFDLNYFRQVLIQYLSTLDSDVNFSQVQERLAKVLMTLVKAVLKKLP